MNFLSRLKGVAALRENFDDMGGAVVFGHGVHVYTHNDAVAFLIMTRAVGWSAAGRRVSIHSAADSVHECTGCDKGKRPVNTIFRFALCATKSQLSC